MKLCLCHDITQAVLIVENRLAVAWFDRCAFQNLLIWLTICYGSNVVRDISEIFIQRDPKKKIILLHLLNDVHKCFRNWLYLNLLN